MSRNTHTGCELVIVELGAAWPASYTPSPGACRVLAEVEGEGPLGFAARVDDFVANAAPVAGSALRALVACNLRADQTAEAARRAVAETLLSRLGSTGTLMFSASPSASDRFRRRLLDLVTELGGAPGAVDRVHALLGDDESRASGPRSSTGTGVVPSGVARVA